MELTSILVALLLVLVFAVVVVGPPLGRKARKGGKRLPPGPFQWPVFGSLFSVQEPLHESFARLCTRYGPVVHLRLGQVNTIVVGNAELAREVLKTRDTEFASRPRTAVFDVLSFNYNGIIGAPFGDAWKHIRRISNIHLFAPNKLTLSSAIRRREVHTMIRRLLRETRNNENGEINFTLLLHQSVLNSAFSLLFGKRHYNEQGGTEATHGSTNFVRLFLKAVLDEGFKFTLGDLVPWLGWLQSSRAERMFKDDLVPKITNFIMELIEERRKQQQQQQQQGVCSDETELQIQDFVDVLTKLKGADAIPDRSIVALLSDFLIGGTSTSEAAIDYAMAEMIRQPKILLKAQAELDQVVGRERLVDESDTSKLPYLQAVVKETLRLHPGAPVGLPHFNPNASRIGDFDIPAKSTVFVNLWAIGRDPQTWPRADEFDPDRFMVECPDVSPLGSHFQLIPFGAGRRICVGYPLAMKFIPFALATLLQAFDWSLLPGMSPSDVDMSDTLGAGLHRAKDLVVCAAPRLSQSLYDKYQEQTMA